MERVVTRLPPPMVGGLDAYAQRWGLDRATAARDLIRSGLIREGLEPKPNGHPPTETP